MKYINQVLINNIHGKVRKKWNKETREKALNHHIQTPFNLHTVLAALIRAPNGGFAGMVTME